MYGSQNNFIAEMKRIYYMVRTESLNKIQVKPSSKG